TKIDRIKQHLTIFPEIITKETIYLSDTTLFNPSLHNNDSITLLLTMAKMISKADVVYWGEVNGEVVSVNMHIGAHGQDFAFELPLGKGAGGKIALDASIYEMHNYSNS